MRRLRHAARLGQDVVRFAAENKAWWLIPLVVVLGLIALLAVAGGSASPFVYTLF